MNTQQAREKWLEVLRDPKSELLEGALELHSNPYKRCCLGHACHAVGAPKSIVFDEVQYLNVSKILPKQVAELLDITLIGEFNKNCELPEWAKGSPYTSLSELNDGESFYSVITPALMADFIEQCFENNWLMPFGRA